jgi:hypothetical protein
MSPQPSGRQKPIAARLRGKASHVGLQGIAAAGQMERIEGVEGADALNCDALDPFQPTVTLRPVS